MAQAGGSLMQVTYLVRVRSGGRIPTRYIHPMSQQADIVILAAITLEYEAVLKVETGASPGTVARGSQPHRLAGVAPHLQQFLAATRAWEALPWWRRWFTPRPPRPTGI